MLAATLLVVFFFYPSHAATWSVCGGGAPSTIQLCEGGGSSPDAGGSACQAPLEAPSVPSGVWSAWVNSSSTTSCKTRTQCLATPCPAGDVTAVPGTNLCRPLTDAECAVKYVGSGRSVMAVARRRCEVFVTASAVDPPPPLVVVMTPTVYSSSPPCGAYGATLTHSVNCNGHRYDAVAMRCRCRDGWTDGANADAANRYCTVRRGAGVRIVPLRPATEHVALDDVDETRRQDFRNTLVVAGNVVACILVLASKARLL